MEELTCVHGQWKDGVCVCEPGYTSEFPGTILHPLYCDREQELLPVGNNNRISFLHYSTLALVVGLATWCFVAFVSLLFIMWNSNRLKKKIEDVERQLIQYEILQKEHNLYPLLHAELWVLPIVFTCINEVKESSKVNTTYHAKVLYSYKPQDKDELYLRYPGDVITDVVELEQGWCKGKLNGTTGFFPLAYTKLYNPANPGSPGESVSSNENVTEI